MFAAFMQQLILPLRAEMSPRTPVSTHAALAEEEERWQAKQAKKYILVIFWISGWGVTLNFDLTNIKSYDNTYNLPHYVTWYYCCL